MPRAIDLTDAYWKMRFYHQPKNKKIGLVGVLIVSNVISIALLLGLGSAFWGLSKFSSTVTSNYIRGKWELSQIKQLTAKELAERDMRVARLIAYQSASPTDILSLAKKVSKILESAPKGHRAFFERALPEAMLIQITHGIPASAVMAMSIYESGYGRSVLAKQYNNYFGIKAFNDWKGQRAKSMPTRDLGVLTSADFRAYDNMREGFLGYADFLKESDRYQRAFKTQSGVQFVSTILRAGYCPDKNYLSNIKRIMSRHNLLELDQLLEETTRNSIQLASFKQ